MVTALVYSSQLSLPAWEADMPSRARQAPSTERRWQRFIPNPTCLPPVSAGEETSPLRFAGLGIGVIRLGFGIMGKRRVRVKSLYVPLGLAAIHRWKG